MTGYRTKEQHPGARLSEKQAAAYVMRACGCTYGEIAKRLRVGRERARQLDKRAEVQIARYARVLQGRGLGR